MPPRLSINSFLGSVCGSGLLILALSAVFFISGCTEESSAGNEAEESSAKNEAKASSEKIEVEEPTATNEAKAKQQPAALSPPFDLTDPARIAAGKGRFSSSCATYCHGINPPLFIGRTGLNPQYVYMAIRDGGIGEKKPMPAWGEIFSPEEIWELVAYIKSLGEW